MPDKNKRVRDMKVPRKPREMTADKASRHAKMAYKQLVKLGDKAVAIALLPDGMIEAMVANEAERENRSKIRKRVSGKLLAVLAEKHPELTDYFRVEVKFYEQHPDKLYVSIVNTRYASWWSWHGDEAWAATEQVSELFNTAGFDTEATEIEHTTANGDDYLLYIVRFKPLKKSDYDW